MPFNQTLFHSEVNTWRGVTGGLYNIRGVYGAVLPTKGTIPLNTTLPGTISVQGRNVLGTSTTFQSGGKIAVGDFLYAAEVVRRIKNIISDTQIELEYEFPAAVIGQAVRVCKANAFRLVTAKSTASADATKLQEAKFVTGDVALFSAPISYDATGGEISFTIND